MKKDYKNYLTAKPENSYIEYNEVGDIVLSINYDVFGCMHQIFLYNTPVGTVLIDRDYLYTKNPSRYNYLQERINEELIAFNQQDDESYG